jgi:hypothetical protein
MEDRTFPIEAHWEASGIVPSSLPKAAANHPAKPCQPTRRRVACGCGAVASDFPRRCALGQPAPPLGPAERSDNTSTIVRGLIDPELFAFGNEGKAAGGAKHSPAKGGTSVVPGSIGG